MIEMPARIARLERDARGYPIPWNVLRADDGTPFFTVSDDRRAWQALREQLCPICGERLGRWKWFIGGPRSAFHEHGWYLDQPAHHECARFALQTCPHLSMPKYAGRIDLINAAKLPEAARILIDETVTTERPEIFVAVAGDQVEVVIQDRGILMPRLRPLRPALAYEYWRHGKQLTEVEAMPFLRNVFGESWTIPEAREKGER